MRTLDLTVDPAAAWPSSIPHGSTISMNVENLGRAAALELSQNAPPLLSLAALIDDLLVPAAASFTWSGRGPGVGREVRRTTSGLFGRFMARWFAHEHLNVASCIAIDGDEVPLPSGRGRELRAVRKDGKEGDLPDWAWVSVAGVVPSAGLLEAKATYYRNKMGATMRGAAKQLERMKIEHKVGSGWRTMRSKSWAIGSGWGTELGVKAGFTAPLLRADDPDTDGDAWDDDHADLLAGMVRLQLAQSLHGLGLLDVAAHLQARSEELRSRPRPVSPTIPGRWRTTSPDGRSQELLGAVVLTPRVGRETDGVLFGYEEAFVADVREGRLRVLEGSDGTSFLPILVPRERVERLGDATD